MKISKLFHWLYAVLMFLPIFMFLPTGLYYAFNDNATAQEKTLQEPIYYQSNDVSSINDLIDDNIYHLSFTSDNYPNNYFILNFKAYYNNIGNLTNNSTYGRPPTAILPYLRTSINTYYDYILCNEQADISSDYGMLYEYTLSLDFVYSSNNSDSYLNLLIPFITKSDALIIKDYEDVIYSMSITDSMVYAWDETWHNDLFSWANDSFLTVPFRYLTDLFSIPSSSTIIYAFSYWLTISIVWLCFDVLIYVPQLAHRWLDKASME